MPVAADQADFADRRCREEANVAQWRDASHGRGRVIATKAPGMWIDPLYVPSLGRNPGRAQVPPSTASRSPRFDRIRPTTEVDRGDSK